MNCQHCEKDIPMDQVPTDTEDCCQEKRPVAAIRQQPVFPASLSQVCLGQNLCPLTSAPAAAGKASFPGRPAVCCALCLAVVPLLAVTVAYSPATKASSLAPTFGEKIRQAVRDRASVDLAENFGDDLRHWVGPGGLLQNWSYDASGFVRPGQTPGSTSNPFPCLITAWSFAV